MCPVFSMTPFLLRAAQMAWDWSGLDTPMAGLWGRYLRHYQTKCPRVTRHMTAWQAGQLWQCQLKYLLIVLCCKVSPQNVSIVRDSEWGPGLRSISTSDSLHFHFNWHLDYQRFNFISVNIKMDELTRSASVSTNISADDHNFNGKLILCYLIYVCRN